MNALVSPQPLAVGEPPPVVTNPVQNTITQQTYAAQLSQPKAAGTSNPNPSKTILKPFEIVHGEPTVKFTMEELRNYSVEEGLHQALVLKFSFERLEMLELRKSLPKMLGTRGHNLVGWLARRHILIRFDLYEDYVLAASKPVNHLLVNGENHQFRIFPWTINFNPKEETSRAFVWISLPNLPPMLFAKQSLLSIASVIGKPLAIDKATLEKSRPSTARVKVELDLLDKRPQRVRIHYVEEKSGQIVELFQRIVYDNLPLYCSNCKHQGHGESTCHFLQDDKQYDANDTVERKNVDKSIQVNEQGPDQVDGLVNDGAHKSTAASQEKTKVSSDGKSGSQQATGSNHKGPALIQSTGKVVGNVQGKAREQWKEVRDNRTNKGAPQKYDQKAAGKELQTVKQKEMQQLQVENKFALLECQEVDNVFVKAPEHGEAEVNKQLEADATVLESTVPLGVHNDRGVVDSSSDDSTINDMRPSGASVTASNNTTALDAAMQSSKGLDAVLFSKDQPLNVSAVGRIVSDIPEGDAAGVSSNSKATILPSGAFRMDSCVVNFAATDFATQSVAVLNKEDTFLGSEMLECAYQPQLASLQQSVADKGTVTTPIADYRNGYKQLAAVASNLEASATISERDVPPKYSTSSQFPPQAGTKMALTGQHLQSFSPSVSICLTDQNAITQPDVMELTGHQAAKAVILEAQITEETEETEVEEQCDVMELEFAAVTVSSSTAAAVDSNAALVQTEFDLEGAKFERSKPTDAIQNHVPRQQQILNMQDCENREAVGSHFGDFSKVDKGDAAVQMQTTSAAFADQVFEESNHTCEQNTEQVSPSTKAKDSEINGNATSNAGLTVTTVVTQTRQQQLVLQAEHTTPKNGQHNQMIARRGVWKDTAVSQPSEVAGDVKLIASAAKSDGKQKEDTGGDAKSGQHPNNATPTDTSEKENTADTRHPTGQSSTTSSNIEKEIKSKLWLQQHEENDDEDAKAWEAATNSLTWIQQREYDDEEDLGIDFVEDSSNDGDICSGDEEMASIVSPIPEIGNSTKVGPVGKLNATAPVFIPSSSQQSVAFSLAGQHQLVTTAPVISLEERQHLDARATLVTVQADKTLTTQADFQDMPNPILAGRDIYEEGEEDDILKQCRAEASRKGDLSPMHSGRSKKSSARDRSSDGRVIEDANIRRPPMRNAKQKQAIQTISTKSNRSKKKS